METRFPHLFRPGRIGALEVKNRIFMAPMATGFCESDGRYSQRQIDWYVTRARGGAGLIETEACAVEKEISKWPTFPSNFLDSSLNIPRAHELTTAVHDFGAKISAQLSIGQGRCLDRASSADRPVSASPVPAFADPSVSCRPLTVDEIKRLTRAFADACERAVRAGFDLIWIHNHGGYLLDQFMSPLWNKRNDEYGGSLEGRLRFPLEIIAAARERVGASFPIGFRMAIDLKLAGSRTHAEGLEMCRRLEAAGIDVLSIDQGCTDSTPFVVPPAYFPHGLWLEDVAAVKQAVGIPVITSGNNFRPEFAERIVAEGTADFVLMGRPLIADPELPNKARAGRVAEIRPCTKCNEGCIGGLFALRGVECQVNATAGKERYYAVSQAGRTRTVMVVGAGPAGMEAARVAALRGHTVSLYEKDAELGGLLRAGARFPFRSELGALIDYFRVSLRQLEVELHTGVKVTPELVTTSGADAVVIAVGAAPRMPPVPGIDGDNVITAVDLTLNDKATGHSVIVVGGGLVGCDVALYLAQQGKKVTIVESGALAEDMNPISRMALVPMLSELGVVIAPLAVREITADGLIGAGSDGKDQMIPADNVVVSLGAVPRNTLAARLENEVNELYVVGDCAIPRGITPAIHEGFVAGWRI
jgi:2-enoate reductase